jgi:hypothetical protein
MMFRSAMVATLAVVLAGAAPLQAAEFDDPEWPCIQRKVEEIAMFQMWSGPMPEGDWRAHDDIRAVAQRIAPRRVAMETVEAEAAAFVEGLEPEARAETLAMLFNGVLDTIQAERRQVMGGIARYALAQASLSDRVEEQQGRLMLLNAAEEKDWDTIEELEDQLAWDVRIYRERAQSLTYVCETPVLLEQRAFAIGRMLAGLI